MYSLNLERTAAFLVLLLVASCLHAQDFLTTKEYKVKRQTTKASFEATIEFPVDGPRAAVAGVVGWMAELFEVDGDFVGDGQRLLHCACDTFLHSGQSWRRTVTIERGYEDANCVTFQSMIKDVDNETWRTADCASFSKKDGHRIQLNEIFKCSEAELKRLMWEYKGDLRLDTDNPADLYPLNAGFIDGWIVVIGPAHHQMGAEFRLRYLEVLSALRTSVNGYFAP